MLHVDMVYISCVDTDIREIIRQISEVEILMDLHVLSSPQSENHICSGWSQCMCVCLLLT